MSSDDNILVGKVLDYNKDTDEVTVETDLETLQKLYNKHPEKFKKFKMFGKTAEEIFGVKDD